VVLSGLQDRLAPLRTWLFPRRVYLQLEDQAISAMALEGERIAWQERVPLPAGLCVNGEPLMVEALGDLLGDLLVERGYAGAHVKAVLPRAATAWRLIEWPEAAWPEQPELLVRQQQDELGLPWSLQDADVLLDPLLAELPAPCSWPHSVLCWRPGSRCSARPVWPWTAWRRCRSASGVR
jgi:type IV pilus assembly protein PilM